MTTSETTKGSCKTEEVMAIDQRLVKSRVASATNELRARQPQKEGGVWDREVRKSGMLNNKAPKGELLRTTLFSGGVVYCSLHDYWKQYLPWKAQDISSHNAIFTDNETVHNSEGFSAFFELDYRGAIPSRDTLLQHVRISQVLIHEIGRQRTQTWT